MNDHLVQANATVQGVPGDSKKNGASHLFPMPLAFRTQHLLFKSPVDVVIDSSPVDVIIDGSPHSCMSSFAHFISIVAVGQLRIVMF